MAGNGEVTIGLVPRYLRGRETGAGPDWSPDDGTPDPVALPAFEAEPSQRAREHGVPSVTEELRRRITESTKPEKRRARPLWFGLALIAVIAAACFMFPDTVLALLPNVDPSR